MASLCFMCIFDLLLSTLHKTNTNESLFLLLLCIYYMQSIENKLIIVHLGGTPYLIKFLLSKG
jgi:hypothetical protein